MAQRPNSQDTEEAASLLHTESVDLEKDGLKILATTQGSNRRRSTLPLARFMSASPKQTPSEYLKSLLHHFVPTFLRKSPSATSSNKASAAPKKASTYGHLDGLRGLAALFVFFFHSSYTIWSVRPGYLSYPQYDSFMKLPFLRLLNGGDPMVSIFFLVSGFVLSVKPITLMHSASYEKLLLSISSGSFRRGFRLFIPCLVSTFIITFIIRLGVYEGTREFASNSVFLAGVQEYHPPRFTSFWEQIWYWCTESFNFFHVWEWNDIYAGNTGLDVHLWTIPTEYRCSMLLFLTHIMVSPMPASSRLISFGGLIIIAGAWGRWEVMEFWLGAILAQLEVLKQNSSPKIQENGLELPKRKAYLRKIASVLLFIIGLYLLSFPDEWWDSTYGYETLRALVPRSFLQVNRFWQAFGSFTIAFSINNSEILQDLFNLGPIKYLGNISFSLYLVHGSIIHTLGYRLLPLMWKLTTRTSPFCIFMGWVLAQIVLTVVVIWAADIFWVNVDMPSNRLCHWLESLFLKRSTSERK